MPCCGNRRKHTREFADQKWDYINLRDFKAGGVGPGFAYAYLWCSLIISIAVYSVDSFTAVQLLAFNRWSSSIEPKIPLNISKWIFSGCIIMSFVNLGYESIRATRVMKRGNIAECYMDSLAVRWESIRLGKGQGWRRFLVFSALTKGKKGAEYIALFTYFSFQTWIRVLVCSAPRQVVNAFTLKSVYEAKLATNSNNVGDNFTGFFDKIKFLAEEDYRQAAILSGMAFTFVIFVFSVLYLLLAILFYVFFLFHWIPRADGGLTGYCERKVNKALLKIVAKRVNKALAKNEAKAAMAFGEKPPHLDRAATLPNVGPINNDALPQMPTVAHQNSFDAKSPSIEMSPLDGSRYGHMRTGTANSNSSFGANASLIRGAADMGYARTESPAPSLPPMDLNNMPPQRPNTSNSQRSYRPGMGGPPGYPNALPLARPGMGNNSMDQHPSMRQRPGPPGYPNSSDPQHAPGHEASHYLGAPTLPNVEADRDSTRTPVSNDLTGVSRQPTIPDLAATGMAMAPQRSGTSNSQRPHQQPQYHQNGAPGPSFVDDFTVSPELASEPRFPSNGRMDSTRTANDMYGNRGAPGATRAPPPAQYQPYNPHGYAAVAPAGNPYDGSELASQRRTPVAGGIVSPMNGEDWAPTRNRSNPGPARVPHHTPQRNVTGPNPTTMPLGGSNSPPGHYPPSRSGTGTSQDMRNYPQQRRGPPGYPNGPPRAQPPPGYGYDVEAQHDRW